MGGLPVWSISKQEVPLSQPDHDGPPGTQRCAASCIPCYLSLLSNGFRHKYASDQYYIYRPYVGRLFPFRSLFRPSIFWSVHTHARSHTLDYMGLDVMSRSVRVRRYALSSSPSPSARSRSLDPDKSMSDGSFPKSLTPNRKHHKLLKDGSEVWSEDIEKIFVEGGGFFALLVDEN